MHVINARDDVTCVCVIKLVKLPPLDHDPMLLTRLMSPPIVINLDRYNSVDGRSRLVIGASLNLILKHVLDW